VTKRDRRVVRSRVDDDHAHIAHVAAQREAEQDDLHQRHEKQNGQRLLVTEDVVQLLHHERAQGGEIHDLAAPGRASRTKTSSMEGALNCALSSPGVPIAAMRPSTMIEIRSQYSASSM